MFASDGNCDSVSDSANVRINFRKNNTKLLFCDKILPPPISVRPIVLSDRRDEGPGAVCGRPQEDRAGVRTGTGIFGARCGGRGCLRLLPEGGLRARPQEPGWGGPGRARCAEVRFFARRLPDSVIIYIFVDEVRELFRLPRGRGAGQPCAAGPVRRPRTCAEGLRAPLRRRKKGRKDDETFFSGKNEKKVTIYYK